MESIYLIGFMGSGKSTVGQLLAGNLGFGYTDTDQLVVDTYGKKITRIFQEDGEEVFRKYESDVLKSVPTANFIISTGGGIVEKSENIRFMKENGTIVYLMASFTEITNRLANDDSRPLWNKNLDAKQKLYEQREKVYTNCANMIIDTEGKTPKMAADEIAGLCK